MRSLLIPLLSVLAVFGWGGPSSARAATGAAPPSQQRRVVSGVHADAIFVSYENGRLLLGSKADLDGNLGVGLDPSLTLFNVEQSRKTTIPNSLSYAFLGSPGSEVWIAPESNPGGTALWPGFSTEGIPTGVLDGNQLTFRLDAVTGPGTLHIFQSSAFGEPIRILTGAGTEFREWTVPRGTHAHANWAFSAPGHYLLTFIASAMINGVSISATQNYAFVVGDVPSATVSATTLAVNTNATVLRSPILLSATVSPANAVGWVEFLDGTTVLGHDAVNAGSASLTTTNLMIGARSVRVRFVPQWLNDFSASTSAPVAVTVMDASGVPFGITGIAASYQPGDVLQARIAGVTLTEGQGIQWRLRPLGTDFTGTVLGQFVLPETNNPESRAGRLDLRLDASFDNYELQAAVMKADQTLATTVWVLVRVSDAVQPLSLTYVGPAPFRIGDTATLVANGRALTPGESLRVALYPGLPHYSLWFVPPSGYSPIAPGTFQFEPSGQALLPMALQVVRDGLVVAQSESLVVDAARVEFFFEGMQPVYRVGQTFSASIRTAPDLGDKVTYSWAMYDTYQNPMKTAKGETGRTFEMPITAGMNGKRMFIQANVIYPSGNVGLVGGAYPFLTVTTNTAQLFLFSSLNEHYHQGDSVSLTLTADPGLTAADSVAWEWRWPGTGWETLPQAAGLSHRLTAEQAMDGLEVRATLNFGPTNVTPVAGPVTILVDDHGIPALQQTKITGLTNVVVGDLVTLTRQLPANVATVLTTHRWERQAPGASEWTVISNTTSAQITFAASLSDDGAQYRVAILKPNGDLAYGPSPAVTLAIESRPTVSPIGNRVVELGEFLPPIAFTVGDVETAPADLVVTASSSNPAVIPNHNLVLGGSGANRTLSLTSALNQVGTTTITITVTDTAAQQTSATFALTVGSPIRATFDRSVGIVKGTDLIDMRLVDIDKDGDLDVLFADRIQSISVLRNNGGGTFGAAIPLPAITVSDIHVADINGDNLLDIVSSVYVDNTYAETAIGVWRNLGSGNFSAQEIVQSTRSTKFVTLTGVADVDRDGLNDLVVSAGGVSYSRNLGNGSFAPVTDILSGGTTWSSALADVDRDGDLDVVRAYEEDGVFKLQLLRNSGASVVSFAVEELALFGQNSLGSIVIGDTDQDGHADIHLLRRTSSGAEISALRGTASAAFLAPVVLGSAPGLTDLKIGDIDGDGRPDLALAARDRNQVLFAQNLGSGVFTDLQEFATDGVYLNPGHEAVAVGDIDGDGRNDLVYMERFAKRIAWSRSRQGENITELKVPVSRSYLNGYPMTFDVFLGFNVRLNTAGGSPTLPVTIGSQIIQVPLVGQPNANTLRFRHLVQSTDVDLDGIQVANSAALNGATITDVHGLPLASSFLQFSSVDTTGIRVNGGAPYVTGITRMDATPAATNSVRYAVAFSEPVTGVTLDDFDLEASGPEGAAITSATGSGDSYVITARIGAGDGTLKLRVLDDDSIVDADSNPLGGVGKANGGFAYGQGYTIRRSTVEPVFNNVITDGHLDIVLLLFEGTWYPYWNGDGFWDTADTVLSAGPDAKAARPADAKWSFLGAAAGEPVWIFPETRSTTTPWPGVGAYDNQPGDFARYFESDPRVNATAEWLKMQLLAVRGPEGGHFSLYQSGLTDPVVFMTTSDGIGADDIAWIPNLDHIHYHWAFTKPGLYQVDVAASGYVDFNQSGAYEPGVDPLSESQVFTLHFGVEVKPSISRIPDQTIEAGTAQTVIPFQVQDLETPPGELVVTATSSNQDVIPNSSIVLQGTGADRTISFPTRAHHEGETRILIRALDASGLEATSSFLTKVQMASTRPDLRLSVSGSTATLLVATKAGWTYQLEATTDLMLPWTDIGARIAGTGQVAEVKWPTSGPSGFFRWRVVTNP